MAKGTLIKVFPFKREISTESTYDSLLIFYRDENGIKRTKFINRAQTYYYLLKDKEAPEALTPPMFIEKDKVERVNVYSDDIFRHIALDTGALQYFDTFSGGSLKNLYKHPYIYDADMDIVDRYIKSFNEEFEPDKDYKLHKVYFDIEVDLMPDGFKKDSRGAIGYSGFPDETIAPCPVNIITMIDEKSMIGYVFIHKNSLNSQIFDYEKNVTEKINTIKNKVLEEDDTFFNDIKVEFFNSEEETIEAFFKTIHNIDPDFALAWNEGFDVLTLQNRLKTLYGRKQELKSQGIKPYDHMLRTICDEKYMFVKDKNGEDMYLTPKAYYRQNKDKSIVDRMDEFTVLDGIVWVDHLVDVKRC